MRGLLCLALVSGFGMAGCFASTKIVPKKLESDASTMSVQRSEWKGKVFRQMRVGAFEVEGIHRTWVGKKSQQLRTSSNIFKQKGYSFSLVEPRGDRWLVHCGIQSFHRLISQERLFALQRRELKGRLGCVLRHALSDQVWQLTLDAQGYQKAITGTLRSRGKWISIRGQVNIRDERKKLLELLGYHLRVGDQLISALDLSSSGRLYVKKGLSRRTRSAVVGASAALLIFGHLHGEL